MRATPVPAAEIRRATGPATARRALAGLAVLCSVIAGRAAAQAPIDRTVAPRAAALAREGERALAVDMLGRYLATAPDDGEAWFLLGRFYLLDARAWHQRGHRGDPSGPLYLDFAATALDQGIGLGIDSAAVFRAIVDMERALLVIEDSGWAAVRDRRTRVPVAPVPSFVAELGRNLLNSCPSGGVILTGGELETLAVWYDALQGRQRRDLLPLRPALYATDGAYRRQMAAAIGVDTALSVQQALAAAAVRRPVCLTPGADSAALPHATWTAVRLVRVSRPGLRPVDGFAVTELVRATRQDGSIWTGEVRQIYLTAARRNPAFCRELAQQMAPGAGEPPVACGP